MKKWFVGLMVSCLVFGGSAHLVPPIDSTVVAAEPSKRPDAKPTPKAPSQRPGTSSGGKNTSGSSKPKDSEHNSAAVADKRREENKPKPAPQPSAPRVEPPVRNNTPREEVRTPTPRVDYEQRANNTVIVVPDYRPSYPTPAYDYHRTPVYNSGTRMSGRAVAWTFGILGGVAALVAAVYFVFFYQWTKD